MKRCLTAACAAFSCAGGPLTWAQDRPLTLEAALARARERSPAILSARARVDEARGRLRGASALRDNPELESAAGRRARDLAPTDLEVGLSQTFELGGRRGARIAGAEAGVARALASADDALRAVFRDVTATFFRTVHAEQRVGAARAAETFAAEVHRIAERRFAAGDIAALEVNVAASALARARSEVRAAEAARVGALGELRILLDIETDEPLGVAGELLEPRVFDAGELTIRALARPDVRALEAELREAEADSRLARGYAWPDVSPGVKFERDEGERVLWAGLTVTLPVFNRGQELEAVSDARAARIRGELEALRRAVRNQVTTAVESYRLRVQAAEELRSTLAALDDNEALARRSYEVGQIGLAELLLVRRETVETRLALLDRLLEAVEARAELESRAGVVR
jgi:outer membrane protein, heavy metal efflux system